MKSYRVNGAGIGLRRGLFNQQNRQFEQFCETVDFIECAPENWIGVGGKFGDIFRYYAERFPIVCHGLSLSLGSPAPLDLGHVRNVKAFLDEFDVLAYSDHLSACSDFGQLYDLMPIPFTEDSVHYVAERIRNVQDILERKIAVEHVSYYAAPGQEMSEIEFINSVLDEADCDFLLDVNNIFVNSVNFSYDPIEFLDNIPAERVCYVHIAGHKVEAEDLRVDTHAASVIESVWDLLHATYQRYGVIPTLLERDFNFPPLSDLLNEVSRIKTIQSQYAETD